jgi:NTP pyrophosphatase (non-canonical NTP hydrolase)
MTFEEFKTNVEQWAEARGIYEHSTALAQALKAVSEVGELADAVIKGDREALKDAIGDVAVCLVNVARMEDIDLCREDFDLGRPTYNGSQSFAGFIAFHFGDLASDIIYHGQPKAGAFEESMANMKDLAALNGLTLEECCAAAWNEIKDRKGRMVPGGAFVKEGDA